MAHSVTLFHDGPITEEFKERLKEWGDLLEKLDEQCTGPDCPLQGVVCDTPDLDCRITAPAVSGVSLVNHLLEPVEAPPC